MLHFESQTQYTIKYVSFSSFTVFLNEMDNDQASQAVEIAITYINKNPAHDLSVQLTTVEGSGTDSKKFLDSSKNDCFY